MLQVWNIDNIYEDVYSIDRMERPVDDLCIADNVYKALTITRNCLGLWNLEDGRLLKTLSSGGISIISVAKITKNGQYIVSAESGELSALKDRMVGLLRTCMKQYFYCSQLKGSIGPLLYNLNNSYWKTTPALWLHSTEKSLSPI